MTRWVRPSGHGRLSFYAMRPSAVQHEAAHVVQQQRGVQLKGNVGEVGDAYERNADAVADRVVQGKPAADLLGPGGGASSTRGPVQFLHGDMATPVRPELGGDGQTTMGQALATKDRETGVRRDKNMNNARKVEFEGKLAAAILKNPQSYAGAVHQTSRGILGYLQRREAQLKISMRDSLMQLGGLSNFFGRLMDDIKGEHEPMFLAQIQKVLSGGGNISNHMLIHHQFWTKIYEEQDVIEGKAAELVDPDELVLRVVLDPTTALRELPGRCDESWAITAIEARRTIVT